MTKEELKEKISKDIEDHKAEKFFRISDYKSNRTKTKRSDPMEVRLHAMGNEYYLDSISHHGVNGQKWGTRLNSIEYVFDSSGANKKKMKYANFT